MKEASYSLAYNLRNQARLVKIEYVQDNYTIWKCNKVKGKTVGELMEKAVEYSKTGKRLFSLWQEHTTRTIKVRLLYPISRPKRAREELQQINTDDRIEEKKGDIEKERTSEEICRQGAAIQDNGIRTQTWNDEEHRQKDGVRQMVQDNEVGTGIEGGSTSNNRRQLRSLDFIFRDIKNSCEHGRRRIFSQRKHVK